jgi:site-specific DNA-cytosine methylase
MTTEIDLLPLKGRQTRVRWASDSARYKALGNSWAVPVVRWIGERINALHGVSGSKD